MKIMSCLCMMTITLVRQVKTCWHEAIGRGIVAFATQSQQSILELGLNLQTVACSCCWKASFEQHVLQKQVQHLMSMPHSNAYTDIMSTHHSTWETTAAFACAEPEVDAWAGACAAGTD